jgi:hypothetical protein
MTGESLQKVAESLWKVPPPPCRRVLGICPACKIVGHVTVKLINGAAYRARIDCRCAPGEAPDPEPLR